MNDKLAAQKPEKVIDAFKSIGPKALARFFAILLLVPLILFLSAGKLNWPMGWVYVGIILVSTAVSRIVIARKNPDLIAERARFFEGEGIKPWDKLIAATVALYGPLIGIVIVGLNVRFAWPPRIPTALQLIALVTFILANFFIFWAITINKFFSAVVRIQKNRGQSVVTTGPYRYIRHPGYLGGVLGHLSTPVMLNAVWGLIPGGIIAITFIVRTALEDRTLKAELDGYQEYAQKVRYRLLPGVW